MTSSQYSPNYRWHLVCCIRVYAKYKGDTDLLSHLSDIRLPAPVPKDVREPLDFDEWSEVREAIDEADYLSDAARNVCTLIALRGIRCGDVLRLTKQDIKVAVKSGILSFEGKGERWHKFNAEPLKAPLEELLALPWKGKRVRNLVCPRSAEKYCQETAGRKIRRVFDRIAEDLDMDPRDLYAHRFRHTYATYFLQEMKGDPEAIFKLQQQMGWAGLNTATNYLRRSRRKELDEVESRMFSNVKR